jgi:5-methyltetrahydropteroyltriglutamate--homocysteine methyltransferase|tara:strand:+ start:1141 stop:2199 length:1059 start_codon:yes stop_codon:yes gene_type:complete
METASGPGLPTTVIGAYPKPGYVPVSDWFDLPDRDYAGRWADEMNSAGTDAEPLFVRAAAEVIADQVEAGIDVVTDGEVRRENYIHYHCRHLSGFDFEDRFETTMRGVLTTTLPTITGPVAAGEPFLVHDWRAAQATTDHPVKVTIPGPLTITDSTVDRHYGDRAALVVDLATAVNSEVRALADAGCTHIQIDEPVFARRLDDALAFGVDALAACFDGVPDNVVRTVHCCCGYPRHLDDDSYEKAPPEAYLDLAEAIDAAPIDRFSLEDAHRPNDLAALLPRFRDTTIILGCVAIARSRMETVDEVRARLTEALRHIDRERLVAGPDCGLGYLGRDLAVAKLRVLCEAASSV